jgi:hypothetical protein
MPRFSGDVKSCQLARLVSDASGKSLDCTINKGFAAFRPISGSISGGTGRAASNIGMRSGSDQIGIRPGGHSNEQQTGLR